MPDSRCVGSMCDFSDLVNSYVVHCNAVTIEEKRPKRQRPLFEEMESQLIKDLVVKLGIGWPQPLRLEMTPANACLIAASYSGSLSEHLSGTKSVGYMHKMEISH